MAQQTIAVHFFPNFVISKLDTNKNAYNYEKVPFIVACHFYVSGVRG